jgi:hypothetical protein
LEKQAILQGGEGKEVAMHRRWGIGLLVCWLWAGSAAADPAPSDKAASHAGNAAGQQAAQPPGRQAAAGQAPAGQADTRRGRDAGHHHHDSYWSDSPWLVYPPPYWYYYPPPLYLPAETFYGPQAMKRFMGVQDAASGWTRTVAASAATAAPGAVLEEKKAPLPRAANPETRGLAWRFISFGDMHFSNEKFGEAYQRYRKAAEIVPELAEAYFRQGFALLGCGRYEMAAKAFKRGVGLDPAWPRSGFRLNELYNANQRAKAAHLEALAAASEKDPNNGDLLFLLGISLFFDGQRDRSTPFFERAAQLAGQGDHLKGFLELVGKK